MSHERAHGPSEKPPMTRIRTKRDLTGPLRVQAEEWEIWRGESRSRCSLQLNVLGGGNLQDGEFAGLEREDGEKEETEHETYGGAQVACRKNEHSIPPTYYTRLWLAWVAIYSCRISTRSEKHGSLRIRPGAGTSHSSPGSGGQGTAESRTGR